VTSKDSDERTAIPGAVSRRPIRSGCAPLSEGLIGTGAVFGVRP
jgi:hypothetical protein